MTVQKNKKNTLGVKVKLSVNKLLRRRPALVIYNCAPWKRELIFKLFPEFKCYFLPLRKSKRILLRVCVKNDVHAILVWGMIQPRIALKFSKSLRIPIWRIEDGFIRSTGLGANHILPYSLCLDKTGLYLDARQPSDIENILQSMKPNDKQKEHARQIIELVKNNQITKYNGPSTNLAPSIYGPKDKKRILVIGQVENDSSVIYGCDKKINNNDLVRLAAKENPGAQIIYKIHPDVLAKKRKKLSNPDDISHLALILNQDMSIEDSLTGVDRVYTISSLTGFEALIRGIPVTTIGAPFYSGWGLTDSRQETPRRTRKLTLEELFYGAYILYPMYFNPQTGDELAIENVIQELIKEKNTEVFHEGLTEDLLAV